MNRYGTQLQGKSVLNGNRFIYVEPLPDDKHLPRINYCAGIICLLFHFGQPKMQRTLVGLVGTPATIVIMNHAARYAKHLATNLETLNVVSMSNSKTLLRLTGKIVFYPNFFRVI